MISHNGTGDLSSSLTRTTHGFGHVARIGSQPTQEFDRPIFAAGAVLWRFKHKVDPHHPESASPEEVEIALIHRPRYEDWSLAKGKVDPGESLPMTAIREIEEETGLHARLGWLLGFIHYPLGDRTKVVYYWTAQVDKGEFQPNDESDELRWLSIDEALSLASYDADKEVIHAAAASLNMGVTRRVLYVRHAKAHDRQGWGGDDNLRPLTKKGRRQSELLSGTLAAYEPSLLSSAAPVRCVHTATPAAQDLDLEVLVDADLGDTLWDSHPTASMEAFIRATSHPVSAVISQGNVIAGIIDTIVRNTETSDHPFEVEDLRVKKSSVWVLHYAGEKLVGMDYLASPLPIK